MIFQLTQTVRGQAVNLEAPGSTPGVGALQGEPGRVLNVGISATTEYKVTKQPCFIFIPRSSNGRTTASDSVNIGSIPVLGANAGVVLVVTRLASTQKLRVRFSLPALYGLVVKWYNTCLVNRDLRFDSELGLQMVPSSGGGQRLQPVEAQFDSVRNLQDLCVGERQLQFPKSRMAGGKPKGH